MSLFGFFKQELKKESPKYADSSMIPPNERQFYQPDEYYTFIVGDPGIMSYKVVTFEDRKTTSVPSANGLYVAEILLLYYCDSVGYPINVGSLYPGFWWFKYGIRDVGGALRSLESRGFINLGENGKYSLTVSGRKELSDNAYVPYMHSYPYTTTEDSTFGPEFNVWSINRLLDRYNKSNWREVIAQEESRVKEARIQAIMLDDRPDKKKVLTDLAETHKKKKDFVTAFYYQNKVKIDLYEFYYGDLLKSAAVSADEKEKLQYLYSAKSQYEEYKNWCTSNKYGKQYFEEHDSTGPHKISRYQSLLKEIAELEYSVNVIVPTILKIIYNDGSAKQADICKKFDVSREIVLAEIRRLENTGQLKTEKRGKFIYLISPETKKENTQ